jgi:hypothetical protein
VDDGSGGELRRSTRFGISRGFFLRGEVKIPTSRAEGVREMGHPRVPTVTYDKITYANSNR